MKTFVMACYNSGDLNLKKIQGESIFEALKDELDYEGPAENVNELLSETNSPDYIVEIIEV